MTHLPAVVRVGLSGVRLLLPWIAVVLASATLAYALNVAIAGGPAATEKRAGVELGTSAGEGSGVVDFEEVAARLSATPTETGAFATTERCAASGYTPMHVGVDSWVITEGRRVGCARRAS